MFTLECMPEDADLFFQILNQRNDVLHSYFTRRNYKHKTVITCLIQKNTAELSFQDIDIKDCITEFTKTYKCYTYKLMANPLAPLVSTVVWLHRDSSLRTSFGSEFISTIHLDWQEQVLRYKTKLLLDITG